MTGILLLALLFATMSAPLASAGRVLKLEELSFTDIDHLDREKSIFLRAVALDLGASIARKGFRNLFLVHCHGSPLHNVAFTDAAAFVSDRYRVQMVNLTSLVIGEGFCSSNVMEKYLGKN